MLNREETHQMCNIVLSYNMVIAVIFFMAVCWQSVYSTEVPIITRDTYDLVRFPKCGGYSSETFTCDKVMIGSIPTGDNRTCTCQCSGRYVTYRDPRLTYIDKSYKYDFTRKGCTWYDYYDEGCRVLKSVDQVVFDGNRKFPKPIIIDLTRPGSLILKKDSTQHLLDGVTIAPHVRTPAKNKWESIADISFTLTSMNMTSDLFKLQWTRIGSNIYAYQGLVMRLDLGQDQSKRKCIMTKIAGTFTETKSCQRQTVDGRCCIFPFVYKNTLYNDCATTDDMTGSWCAVGLNTNVTEGNHKWRENCAVPTAKTSTQQITPEATTHQVRRSSVSPKSTASLPHKSSTTQKVQSPADSSGDSESNKTIIIAIVVSLAVFLVVLLILVIVCHRCRRISAKSVARKTASDEVVADENGYVTINEESPPRTRRLKNVVYQESMEMSHDRPSAIAAAHPNSSTGHSSSLYDNPDDVRPEVQTDAIYNMPEADYSLITTPDKQQKTDARALGPPDDTSNNVYSEPTDDEQVLVEANPLYGTANDVPCATENKPDKYSPNKTGEIYDEPSEIPSSKNVYDTPEGTDK